MGEGRIGHWVALNGIKRDPDVFLEAHSVTNWNLMQWRFTDNYVSRWAANYPRWPSRDYCTMSHCLCTVLRHVDCIYGDHLGCDSGGWYHLEHIARILYHGVTEHNVRNQAWRPPWVSELEVRLRGKGLLDHMSEEKWLFVILRALSPGTHEPPRYQLILEKRQGSDPMEFVRPRAVRTVSGHSSINILDPERVAAQVPEGILAHISGVFHITEMENLPSIFRHGLQPGGRHGFPVRTYTLCRFSHWTQEMNICKASNVENFA